MTERRLSDPTSAGSPRTRSLPLPLRTAQTSTALHHGLVAASSTRDDNPATALFADDYQFGPGVSLPNYDVTPDDRFIMIRCGPNGGKLRIVLNWTEELKQILAAGGAQ